MRLRLHNPNTDSALTARLVQAVRSYLVADDTLLATTAGDGPAFIGSEQTIAAARSRLPEALRAHAQGCDAVLLGCFGDLGIENVRTSLGPPIISLSDACFATAPLLGLRIAIVTTSPFWAERLRADVVRHDLSRSIVAIASIAAAPPAQDALVEACRCAIAQVATENRVDAIILGGALLVTVRPQLLNVSPLPIVDNLGTAVGLCRALMA